MATIRKRSWISSGQQKTAWQVDYHDQHGKRRAKQFTTRKAAADFLATATYEVKQGTHTPPSAKTTVGEAVELWLQRARAEGVRRPTLRTYDAIARTHVLPILGRVRLAQLSRPAVEQYRDDLLLGNVPDGRPRSTIMAKKALGCLKAALGSAHKRGMIAQNVASGVRVRVERVQLEVGQDVPAKADVLAMLAAVTDRDRAMLLVAAFCGLRASELRALRWQDVDLQANRIMVRQRADRWGGIDRPKSRAGRRDVPMQVPEVRKALLEHKVASAPGADLVFPRGADDGVMDHSQVYRRLGAIQVAAGIVDDHGKARFGPHSLRHFCASLLIERGQYSLKRIQTILGHASIQMTMDIYSHLLSDDDEPSEVGVRELLG